MVERTSVNEAKKAIWLRLQAYVSDSEIWESEIIEEDWKPETFNRALISIFYQLERKL